MYRLKRLNVVKETESEAKRDFLLGQGYVLLGEPDRTGKSLEEMLLPELKRYAEEKDIAISGLKTKKEIVEAIRGAEGCGDHADEGGTGAPAE